MSHIQEVIASEDRAAREAEERREAVKARKLAGLDWPGYATYVREIEAHIRRRFPSLGGDFEVRPWSTKDVRPEYRVDFTLHLDSRSRDALYSLAPHTRTSRPFYFTLEDGGQNHKIMTDADLKRAVRRILAIDQDELERQVAALSEPSPYPIGNTD